MNLKILYITLGILSTELLAAQNQTMEMSLEQVVKIARLESPDARTARHSFRSAYWNYKYYRANYLPSLSLSSDPNLNRAINKITMGTVPLSLSSKIC
jgi:outer membrane protein TolC